jgi:CBS domain-containing protein/sporulation protein YlmC with PRC-barrel domain
MVAVLEREFFLSEILGRKVYLKSAKLGRLGDMVIVESGKVPEVSHLVVSRSFGHPSLLIPWDKVVLVSNNEIVVDVDILGEYEKPPADSMILLKDHILDKKILDIDDHEVEVVYDVKLEYQNGKLYASKVDFSRNALLRRIGLKALARFTSEHSEDSMVSWAYVQPLPEHIGSFSGNIKLSVLKENIHEIHPVDLADILEELDQEQRLAVFDQLDTEHASDTLEEVEPRVQRELINSMRKERVAELINDMSPAQAADIMAILPAAEADELLRLINKDSASKVQQIIDEHNENILLFAAQRCIKLPPGERVRDVMSDYRELARNKDVIMYVYVTDAADKLLGVIDLHELIEADPEQILADIMTTNVISLNTKDTLREAVELFARYSFRAIPVVDDADKLMGIVPFRDIKGLKHRLI